MLDDVRAEGIRKRINNCVTYNFGMYDANLLAHVDAQFLLNELQVADQRNRELELFLSSINTQPFGSLLVDLFNVSSDKEGAEGSIRLAIAAAQLGMTVDDLVPAVRALHGNQSESFGLMKVSRRLSEIAARLGAPGE